MNKTALLIDRRQKVRFCTAYDRALLVLFSSYCMTNCLSLLLSIFQVFGCISINHVLQTVLRDV